MFRATLGIPVAQLDPVVRLRDTDESEVAPRDGGKRLSRLTKEVLSDPRSSLSRGGAPYLLQLGKKRVARLLP